MMPGGTLTFTGSPHDKPAGSREIASHIPSTLSINEFLTRIKETFASANINCCLTSGNSGSMDKKAPPAFNIAARAMINGVQLLYSMMRSGKPSARLLAIPSGQRRLNLPPFQGERRTRMSWTGWLRNGRRGIHQKK